MLAERLMRGRSRGLGGSIQNRPQATPTRGGSHRCSSLFGADECIRPDRSDRHRWPWMGPRRRRGWRRRARKCGRGLRRSAVALPYQPTLHKTLVNGQTRTSSTRSSRAERPGEGRAAPGRRPLHRTSLTRQNEENGPRYRRHRPRRRIPVPQPRAQRTGGGAKWFASATRRQGVHAAELWELGSRDWE